MTQLPVLKNVKKLTGKETENVIITSPNHHNKLRSIENQRKIDIEMKKRNCVGSVDYAIVKIGKPVANNGKHKAIKNIKLMPIR